MLKQIARKERGSVSMSTTMPELGMTWALMSRVYCRRMILASSMTPAPHTSGRVLTLGGSEMHICNSGLGAAKLLQSTLLQTVDRPRVRGGRGALAVGARDVFRSQSDR